MAVGNTRSYGGGMLICPNADPYDGLLDVTIIHPVSRLRLLRLFPEMYSGKFVRDPSVEPIRVSEELIEGPGLVGFAYGEMVGAAPLRVWCHAPAGFCTTRLIWEPRMPTLKLGSAPLTLQLRACRRSSSR